MDNKKKINSISVKHQRNRSRNQNSSSEQTSFSPNNSLSTRKNSQQIKTLSPFQKIFEKSIPLLKKNRKLSQISDVYDFSIKNLKKEHSEQFPMIVNSNGNINVNMNSPKDSRSRNNSRNIKNNNTKPFNKQFFSSDNNSNNFLNKNPVSIRLTKNNHGSPFKKSYSSLPTNNLLSERTKKKSIKIFTQPESERIKNIFRGDVGVNKDILKCDLLLSYRKKNQKEEGKIYKTVESPREEILSFDSFSNYDNVKINKKLLENLKVINEQQKEKIKKIQKERVMKLKNNKTLEKLPKKSIIKKLSLSSSSSKEKKKVLLSQTTSIRSTEGYEEFIQKLKDSYKIKANNEAFNFISDLCDDYYDEVRMIYKNQTQNQTDFLDKQVKIKKSSLKKILNEKMYIYHQTSIWKKYDEYYNCKIKLEFQPYKSKEESFPFEVYVTPKANLSIELTGTNYLLDKYFEINSEIVGDYVFNIKSNLFSSPENQEEKRIKLRSTYTKSGIFETFLPSFETKTYQENMLYIQKRIYQDYLGEREEELFCYSSENNTTARTIRNMRKVRTRMKTISTFREKAKKKKADLAVLKHKNFFEWRKSLKFLPKNLFCIKKKKGKKSIIGEKLSKKTKFLSRSSAIFNSPELLNLFTHSQNLFQIIMGLITRNEYKLIQEIFAKNSIDININEQDEKGNTMLIQACRSNLIEMAKFFLNKGADTNICNTYDNTALHYAFSHKNFNLVDLLTSFGANENIKNYKGKIPCECVNGINEEEAEQ